MPNSEIPEDVTKTNVAILKSAVPGQSYTVFRLQNTPSVQFHLQPGANTATVRAKFLLDGSKVPPGSSGVGDSVLPGDTLVFSGNHGGDLGTNFVFDILNTKVQVVNPKDSWAPAELLIELEVPVTD